jgi:hypothetical protein
MKTWLLVYIVLSNDGIDVGQVASVMTMAECFEARDQLVLQVSDDEYFPINQQAVCIQTDVGF